MNPTGSRLTPTSLQSVLSQALQMLQSPADLVTQAGYLRELVRGLPPDQAELLSRPAFERAGLVSLCANFFDVPEGAETTPQTIRIPYDCWIRGVEALAITQINEETVRAVGNLLLPTQERSAWIRYGTNMRGIFEVNWKLNGKQGFISTGLAEILAPATLVTGDGHWSVPLDWQLQQEDEIAVRVRNRIDRFMPATCVNQPVETTIPWVAVVFWAEDVSG